MALKANRFIAILLLLLLAAAPALAESGKTYSMMGLETEDSTRVWEDNQFFKRMEAATGITFTFREYTNAADYQRAKDEAFAGGELPDVFFKAQLTPEEEMRYVQSGQLVDLAPYLEEAAPNLYAILEARPDWRAIVTQPDGAIASLPILSGAERQCCIWINRSWLDALGLDMPGTIEEYTEVLRAFRDGDPNGNGQLDEIPLSFISPWEAKFLLHAWGLTPNDYNLYVDETGTVQFAPYDPVYREFVEWLKMGTKEGIIDADAFRMPQSYRSQLYSDSSSDTASQPVTYGSFMTIAPYTIVDMDKTTDFAVLTPLAYEGERVYRRLLNGVGRGTFAITSACDDIAGMLGWVDTLYTEEGGRLAFAGVEGEDYTLHADGTWKWDAGDDSMYLMTLVDTAVIANDTLTPGLEPAAFLRNSEITADNYTRRQTDTIRDMLVDPFPVTWPTDEAREARIAELQLGLAECLDTAIANFAMGKTELTDETWQALLDELDALGVDEFVALWQAKYDELAQ